MEIWGVVLTIIAMFVAGHITGTLAGVTNPRYGLVHGIVMFGLSVTSALLIVIMGNAFGGTPVTLAGHSYVIGLFSHLGWALFVGLFLGWLAAIGGASSAHKEFPSVVQQQIRHA